MRLFCLEVKRVLKSRRTFILLAVALVMSAAMAYLPIAFESINRPNPDGTKTELDGMQDCGEKKSSPCNGILYIWIRILHT